MLHKADPSLNIAECLAMIGMYNEAIEFFQHDPNNPNVLNVGLCMLAAQRPSHIRKLIVHYKRLATKTWDEMQLLRLLTDMLEQRNVYGFEDLLFQYDQYSPLNDWCVVMLLRIKRQTKW